MIKQTMTITLPSTSEALTITAEPAVNVTTHDHSKLSNLDYEHSGHTGFASSADVSTLQTNLDTEANTRATNDSLVLTNAKQYADNLVNNEANIRDTKDNLLSQRITTIESDYLKAADKTELNNKINSKASEADLEALQVSLAKTNKNVSEEISRAKNAENDLSNTIIGVNASLENEVTRATDKENEINASLYAAKSEINSEINELKAKDASLQENINNVNTRATSAETALGARITTIESDYLKTADKNNLQSQIDVIKADYLKEEDKTEVENKISAEQSRAETAETSLSSKITTINSKIPTAASSTNQLADKDFVNDAISTSTATFRGTFNLITDLHLTLSATQADIIAALKSKVTIVTKNDYVYVAIPQTESTPTAIKAYDRYKYETTWVYEYTLNNSSFTSEQWAAINSGITSGTLDQILADIENAQTDISTLNTNLSTETANREAADTSIRNDLGNRIKTIEDNYATTAQVTEVDNKITNEASRATTAENGLSTRISTIEGDYLKAADKTELETKISNEATTRKNADDNLQANINTQVSAEKTRAEAAEKTLHDTFDLYSLIVNTGSKVELSMADNKLKAILRDKNDNAISTSEVPMDLNTYTVTIM